MTIWLLGLGSGANFMETHDQEEAATKIQAIYRGRATRKEQSAEMISALNYMEVCEQEDAAIKIQAIYRGNAARGTVLQTRVSDR